MCGNRGFTLLELLVALVVLAVGFSVVFEVLSFARLEYSSAYELSGDIIKLNNALVEGKTEGLEVEKKSLEDYPQLGLWVECAQSFCLLPHRSPEG